ncbi:hypothetical protein DVA67_014025 [Solirubrobacter sp. CPCC 204708]|uniref:Uncharacterized protein n=1 Tax=Solirubrobacter deserti TaxID=2282478 RepID=A0ABT4RBV4_9ACTN|nr:hypothetical protein [Solirubrobacter deserti]MBE2317095.1 hypothetical protein [Solirubrobacter deserti]MDA0136013.1 hypothetical protein [Solirubrobacter deserti]
MDADRRDTILVVIAILGALLSFWIPMPWGAIPAAVTLLIAGAALIRSRRAKQD